MSSIYALEGNVVDRISAKNGKGWCEDVSPTLNTQDRHAVVYAIEGNGIRPSHMGVGYSDCGKSYTLNATEMHAVCFEACGDRDNPSVAVSDKAYCIPANPMSDRQQAVCYAVSCKQISLNVSRTANTIGANDYKEAQAVCFRKSCKPSSDGKGEKWVCDDVSNTLNGFEFHSQVRTPEIVCYSPNGNHCGAFLQSEKSATLETRYHYGSGGDAALILKPRNADNDPSETGDKSSQSKIVGTDLYNGEITGDTAVTITAAVGGTNTSGPKVICREE